MKKLPSFVYTRTSAIALVAEQYWAQLYLEYADENEVYYSWRIVDDLGETLEEAHDKNLMVGPEKYHSPSLVALYHLLKMITLNDRRFAVPGLTQFGWEDTHLEQVIDDILKHAPAVKEWTIV